ncbi:MAG: sulfatase [Candidatus Azobacteroides sp.]|nr:sulfatase [Candidatus Azobacteroides sp.]
MKEKLLFLSSLSLLSPVAQGKEGNVRTQTQEKPNFVFILLDDLAFDAIGQSGRYPFLETPNISRLQNEGMTFQNCFAVHSLSSPSRASMLTGQYSHTHGVTMNNAVDPNWSEHPSYPMLLQKSGYNTAFVGKIHMSLAGGKKAIRPGFDYWVSMKGQGEYYNCKINVNGKDTVCPEYITDALTGYALDFLQNRKDKTKPFSLCLWHKAVHSPYTPAPRHENLYEKERLPEPPNGTFKETFRNKPEWQRIRAMNTWKQRPVKGVIPSELPVRKWDPKEKKYFDILRALQSVDESIGKVMDYLESTGELDNTVIVFSSDNGYFMGDHTLIDKRIAYESSIRIPLIIRYPKMIQSKSTASEMCLSIDFAPTFLDLAGVQIPSSMQGESMKDILQGKKNPEWRKSFLYEYFLEDFYPKAGPGMVAVRTEQFKYVHSFVNGDSDELYDLIKDPGEMVNLVDNKKYTEQLMLLKKELATLQAKYQYNPDKDWWNKIIIPDRVDQWKDKGKNMNNRNNNKKNTPTEEE